MKKIVKIVVSGVIGFAVTYTTSFKGADLGDVNTLIDFVLSSLTATALLYILVIIIVGCGSKK